MWYLCPDVVTIPTTTEISSNFPPSCGVFVFLLFSEKGVIAFLLCAMVQALPAISNANSWSRPPSGVFLASELHSWMISFSTALSNLSEADWKSETPLCDLSTRFHRLVCLFTFSRIFFWYTLSQSPSVATTMISPSISVNVIWSAFFRSDWSE